MIYFCCHAPDFPAEDQTTLQDQQALLTQRLDKLAETMVSDDQQKWFAVSINEVQSSLEAYRTGNILRGESDMQSAEEHLRKAFSGSDIKVGFIAGESREAAKT